MPVCPKCNSLAVGDKCGTCGAAIVREAQPATGMQSVVVPGLELGSIATATPSTVPGLEPQKKHRQASAYLSLQPSEEAVLHAASRIFAAYVASGAVNEDNQSEMSDRAVRLATRMALVIEKYVQSDNEDW